MARRSQGDGVGRVKERDDVCAAWRALGTDSWHSLRARQLEVLSLDTAHGRAQALVTAAQHRGETLSNLGMVSPHFLNPGFKAGVDLNPAKMDAYIVLARAIERLMYALLARDTPHDPDHDCVVARSAIE